MSEKTAVEGVVDDADVSNPEVCVAFLALNPGSTTTDVAKAVFSPDTTEEMRNADRKVRYYFEEKFDHIVSVESEEGTNRYRADESSVWFGTGSIEIDPVEGEEPVAVGLGDTLMYSDKDGNPVITPLSATK